jgi:hypothetical protein
MEAVASWRTSMSQRLPLQPEKKAWNYSADKTGRLSDNLQLRSCMRNSSQLSTQAWLGSCMHLDQAACIISPWCPHFAANDFGGQSMALEWPIWRNWQCPSSRTNSYNSYPSCSRISLCHLVLGCTAPRLAGRAPRLSCPPPSACSSMTTTHRSETLNRCSRQRKCCERVGGCWVSVLWDYNPRSPNWWNCSSC